MIKKINFTLTKTIYKFHTSRAFSSKKLDELWFNAEKLPEDFKQKFIREAIPVKTFQTKYVTSSGPGGQNVNKVATKVEIRFHLEKSLNWLPLYIVNKLKTGEVITSGKINKEMEYIVSSSRTRSQLGNLEDCIDKIYEDVIRIADTVPKPISQDAIKRISKLQNIEKERKKADKSFRAAKKADRRKKDFKD